MVFLTQEQIEELNKQLPLIIKYLQENPDVKFDGKINIEKLIATNKMNADDFIKKLNEIK
jgi:lysozyme family protein